jgi:dihydropteroate synthase
MSMILRQSTINARGRLLDLSSPILMGVLNITPDSFYDGGAYDSVEDSVVHASKMIAEGAHVIDIGGMSSRPGAEMIDASEEVDRIAPVIERILKVEPDAIISIDTIYAATAREGLQLGAHILNDISGGRFDEEIVAVAAEYGAPFICMHMQGIPRTMQVEPAYDNVARDILQFFVERVSVLRDAGVKDIILDPGFGFGKTAAHNFQLLQKLGVFRFLELPILAGISRKSMVCRVLNISPKEALNGSTALHMLALQNGAGILRVHDVKEAQEVIRLYNFYESIKNQNDRTTTHAL